MAKIFVDTSAWIAAFSKNDIHHPEIAKFFSVHQPPVSTYFSSNYVFSETITHIIYHANWHFAAKFSDYFNKSVDQKILTYLWIDTDLEKKAVKLLDKYSDHKLSLTDATTAVLMKLHRIDQILTFDADFQKLGFATSVK